MKEEYKICPYCNNAVDKKDKQCPYCLKSLTRRNNPTIQTNNEPINSNNVDRDSWIKDNKEWKGWSYHSKEIWNATLHLTTVSRWSDKRLW